MGSLERNIETVEKVQRRFTKRLKGPTSRLYILVLEAPRDQDW